MKSFPHFDAHTVAWKAPQPKPRWGFLILSITLAAGFYQLGCILPHYQRLQVLEAQLEQKQAHIQESQPKHPIRLDRATEQEHEQRSAALHHLQHALKRDIGALLVSLEHTLVPGIAWRRIEWQGSQAQHATRLLLELEAKNPEVLSHWRKEIAPTMPLWRAVALTQEHMLPPQFNIIPLQATLEVQLNWDKAGETHATLSRENLRISEQKSTIHFASSSGLPATPWPGHSNPIGNTGAIHPPLVPGIAARPTTVSDPSHAVNSTTSRASSERRTP